MVSRNCRRCRTLALRSRSTLRRFRLSTWAPQPHDERKGHMSTEPPRASDEANVLLEISNAVVRLFKEQFGRGPTSARTYWTGPDALSVILEDTLTPAERAMVAMGEHQRLRDMRLFFQVATTREFCKAIERLSAARCAHSSAERTPTSEVSRSRTSCCIPTG